MSLPLTPQLSRQTFTEMQPAFGQTRVAPVSCQAPVMCSGQRPESLRPLAWTQGRRRDLSAALEHPSRNDPIQIRPESRI
jgi:hypothetical protein